MPSHYEEQTQFLGEIQTKLYNCPLPAEAIHPGEALYLERDFHHPANPHAIRAMTAGHEKAGTVAKNKSAWLAPLLDRGAIRLEARIASEWNPGRPKPGEGYPLTLRVYLAPAGFSILEPNTHPRTELEILHETIRQIYGSLAGQADPPLMAGMVNRLEKFAEGDLAPETHLLLALLQAKGQAADEIPSGSLLEKIQSRIRSIRIGEPLYHRNLTVFPLYSRNGSKAPYVLLRSALVTGVVEIQEVSEGGRVSELMIHNRGAQPVLVPEGEILVGAKQNRVINISILVAAHHSQRIPVSCVERGRWRYASPRFQSAFFAHPKLRSEKTRSVYLSRKATGKAYSDQGKVWQEVDEHLHKLCASSPTASVTDGYEKSEAQIRDYQDKFVLPENAAGVLVGFGNLIAGLDYFGYPEIFRQVWDRLAGSYFTQALVDVRDAPITDKRVAYDFFEKVSRAIELCEPSLGLGNEFMIKGHELTGTGVWYEDALCHLSVFM
ncbi:MAG TPA: HIRAN domain-containing protein [bacterium]|nr:HIRAN domain-containing protein [bacterium]